MATLGQLWAWKYEGQDEVGIQKPGNSWVFKSAASEAIPILRHADHITNLRKVKVVDEDAIVLTGITKAEFIWFTDGLNTTGSLSHAPFPRQFESIKERILKQLDPTQSSSRKG